jgi:hypothetical protein
VETRRQFLLAQLESLRKELDELPPRTQRTGTSDNAAAQSQPQEPEWVTIRADEYRLLQLQARAMDVVQEGRRGKSHSQRSKTFGSCASLQTTTFGGQCFALLSEALFTKVMTVILLSLWQCWHCRHHHC